MSVKRTAITAAGMFIAGALIAGGYFYWKNLRGAGPAFRSPPADVAEVLRHAPEDPADRPLALPPGFRVSLFAEGLPGARVLVQDGRGDFWVSQTREGLVTRLEVEDDSVARRTGVFANLRGPHGLAFHPGDPFLLYIAEEHQISRVRIDGEDSLRAVAELPAGGRHTTRTLGFGPDGRLYVSIGSSCNICLEEDPRRGAIWVLEPDGAEFRPFATGLRNAVFFTWNPVDGTMWATEMGRDFLGDDLPPDEVNQIEEGGFYGWPYCFGQNVPDPEFRSAEGVCDTARAAAVDIPAHSAPLGLAFVPEEGWPADYRHDLLVAYHGSWNRREPTGYKVVRLKRGETGGFEGTEDFISGWLVGDRALGRPVDLLVRPGGVAYLTDDKAGVIYRITWEGDL